MWRVIISYILDICIFGKKICGCYGIYLYYFVLCIWIFVVLFFLLLVVFFLVVMEFIYIILFCVFGYLWYYFFYYLWFFLKLVREYGDVRIGGMFIAQQHEHHTQ